DDRDRNRDGDDHRRRPVAQVREQDDHGQDPAPDRGVRNVVDRLLYESALVLDNRELDIATALVDALSFGANRLGDGDGVRAGLLPETDADRRHAADLDVAADVAERE